MENHFNLPKEVIQENISAGAVKAERKLGQLILMGIMAGAFIALGGASSNVAVHGIADVGLSRTLAGVIFPVGLMLIVLVGGELFTGNCLILMAVLNKKTTIGKMLANLVIVYCSNLVGALIMDYLIFYSGQLNYSGGGLGAYTIKVAAAKVAISPLTGIASGILCNMLVCLAILMAGAARDVAGKILAIFFPICAFVVGGYEHCVANMFYIPAGILAASNPAYAAKAEELYGITMQQCQELTSAASLRNFIPVTIGNMIGGALFIGVMYYFIFIHKKEK